MHVDLRRLAARQDDLVAVWQLRALGWSPEAVRQRLRKAGARRIHSGVYALRQSPLDRRQAWLAATFTSPSSYLAVESAAACFGFLRWSGSFETIVRPGDGGRRRCRGLVITHSTTLAGDTTSHNGIALTTAERTLLDIVPSLTDVRKRKAMREALRLRVATTESMRTTLERHERRPGAAFLMDLVTRYATLQYERTRSDPEAFALEVFHDAGFEQPLVNVKVHGEEADLTWMRARRIIEIDGPQYHRFKDDDVRKATIWRNAGFTVRRISTDDVFADPARLLELARD
jgi:hypothetical protein